MCGRTSARREPPGRATSSVEPSHPTQLTHPHGPSNGRLGSPAHYSDRRAFCDTEYAAGQNRPPSLVPLVPIRVASPRPASGLDDGLADRCCRTDQDERNEGRRKKGPLGIHRFRRFAWRGLRREPRSPLAKTPRAPRNPGQTRTSPWRSLRLCERHSLFDLRDLHHAIGIIWKHSSVVASNADSLSVAGGNSQFMRKVVLGGFSRTGGVARAVRFCNSTR
jgi:hypothetical protein